MINYNNFNKNQNLDNLKIFCIIPAYNEENKIIEVLKKVIPLVSSTIVIDDASTDNTWNKLTNFHSSQNQGSLILLQHVINRGQGASLQTGNECALKLNADIIVHFDADGQFLASEIKDMLQPIINGEAEVVLGSRFLEKKSNIPWLKNNLIFPLARITNKIFIGVNLTDPQSGFRALSRESAKKIIIDQDRMAHCSEILNKIIRNNLRVKEVPTTVIYHHFGQRFSGGIRILKDLLLAKFIE